MLSKKTGRGAEDERMFNKFLEGKINMDEYTAHLNAKTSKHTRGHKRTNLNRTAIVGSERANKRLSDFFGGPPRADSGKEDAAKPGPGLQMSLKDILAELDEPEELQV